MVKAIWNDKTIAESSETIVIEGNHYFPPTSIQKQYLQENSKRTICPWKGQAHYYDIVVGEKINRGAAWNYFEPKSTAIQIKEYFAFWNGVIVEEN